MCFSTRWNTSLRTTLVQIRRKLSTVGWVRNLEVKSRPIVSEHWLYIYVYSIWTGNCNEHTDTISKRYQCENILSNNLIKCELMALYLYMSTIYMLAVGEVQDILFVRWMSEIIVPQRIIVR